MTSDVDTGGQLKGTGAQLSNTWRGCDTGACPERARLGRRAGRVLGGQQQGVALPAATAQSCRTEAAAAALQLEQQGEGEAGARHADRVAEGNGAAVDVDDVVGNAEVAHRRQA